MNLGTFSNLNSRLPILGVAFSDKEISAAVFPEKDTEPIASVAAPVPIGVIKNGEIKDENKVAEIIHELVKELPKHSRQCVVSIPTTLTYSTIIRLPQTLTNPEQVKSAAKLLIPGILPWKSADTTSDFRYQIIDGTINEDNTIQADRTIVSLIAAPREIIDTYARVILSAGLTPLALESDAMSQVRLLETPPGTYAVSLTTGETHAYLSVGRDGEADFAFAFPLARASNMNALLDEADHIRMFAEYELGVDIKKGEGALSYRTSITDRLPRGATTPTSYAAVGAAARGLALLYSERAGSNKEAPTLLPLDSFTIAGFLKLQNTLLLVRTLSIAIIIIYILISSIALFTFNTAASSIVAQKPELGIQAEINNMVNKFTQISSTFSVLDSAAKDMMRWSSSLSAIDSAFTPGVFPINMSANNTIGPFQITGIAGTRAEFNQFRAVLPTNPAIRAPQVSLGAADIELRIPFSAVLFPNPI